jgi:surface protein
MLLTKAVSCLLRINSVAPSITNKCHKPVVMTTKGMATKTPYSLRRGSLLTNDLLMVRKSSPLIITRRNSFNSDGKDLEDAHTEMLLAFQNMKQGGLVNVETSSNLKEPIFKAKIDKSATKAPDESSTVKIWKAISRMDLVKAVKQWCKDPVLAESQYGHISTWDTSQITNMNQLLRYTPDFNADISNWDVTNVTDMEEMFVGCKKPLNRWNVHKVDFMNCMFYGCAAFNQPLDQWDVRNVIDMTLMFKDCSAFDQPVDEWWDNSFKTKCTPFVDDIFIKSRCEEAYLQKVKLQSEK